MSKYEFLLALMSIVVGGSTIGLIVSSVTKIVMRRGASSLGEGTVARIDDRLGRMEQAIDAMAVEMERISEGQRFTTKLLAEREPAREALRDGSRDASREGSRDKLKA
ncbi:MAG: hypothetical protein ABIT38_18145 [Gemmatimonadaceae bacterium]